MQHTLDLFQVSFTHTCLVSNWPTQDQISSALLVFVLIRTYVPSSHKTGSRLVDLHDGFFFFFFLHVPIAPQHTFSVVCFPRTCIPVSTIWPLSSAMGVHEMYAVSPVASDGQHDWLQCALTQGEGHLGHVQPPYTHYGTPGSFGKKNQSRLHR